MSDPVPEDPGKVEIQEGLGEAFRDLATWRQRWEADRAFAIPSRPTGLRGRLNAWVKRALEPLVTALWKRQTAFNLSVINHLEATVRTRGDLRQVRNDLLRDVQNNHRRISHLEAFKREGFGDVMRHSDALYAVVDQKLDRYMARKAERRGMTHLLIDRFRFDSFAPASDERGSNLLTRFGHTVYLIFMVTPPPATVERAWLRGKQVGRYKAVDDLLDHNIEAFNGIPVLFFTWALRHDKTVYYEFLDNSVVHKQTPKTIAFGLNGEMYIAEFKCMLDIVRYTRINIEAGCADEVYPSAADMAPAANTEFVVDCARKIPRINFVERRSGLVYACMQSGHMQWVDHALLQGVMADYEAQAGLLAMAPRLLQDLHKIDQQDARPVPGEALRHTLGAMD